MFLSRSRVDKGLSRTDNMRRLREATIVAVVVCIHGSCAADGALGVNSCDEL
jgi:hypothetical protein